MAKRLKFDESGDTDELQALFDSIASEPAQPKLEVVEEQSDDADSDELQALFDSVAEEFGTVPLPTVRPPAAAPAPKCRPKQRRPAVSPLATRRQVATPCSTASAR